MTADMTAEMSHQLPTLQTPWVRALAWCCFAEPPLQPGELPAAAPPLPLSDARRQWLLELDRQPKPLLDWLDQRCRSPRLGLVFECLWHFFLDQDPQTELIANNLPIRDGDRSVGELDILYHCHQRDTVVHLELAVKFYLDAGRPLIAARDQSRWLGPDRRDRLDKKIDRLQQHQLTLPHTQWGQAALAELGIREWSTELVFAGRLFQSINPQESINPRDGIKPQANLAELPSNTWIHWRHWHNSDLAKLDWTHLQKPDWFTGIGLPLEQSLPDLGSKGPKRPIMLNWQQRRLMLCPDQWPTLEDAA